MWQNKLRQIIDILESSNVNEIEVSFWGHRFRVSKGNSTLDSASISKQQVLAIDKAVSEDSFEEKTDDIAGIEVRAPMVGTFYRSPSPESSPFVSEGNHVSIGQTLCIIEAMKIMNEITSETTGHIVKIHVEDAQPVEYEQLLFVIEPD